MNRHLRDRRSPCYDGWHEGVVPKPLALISGIGEGMTVTNRFSRGDVPAKILPGRPLQVSCRADSLGGGHDAGEHQARNRDARPDDGVLISWQRRRNPSMKRAAC